MMALRSIGPPARSTVDRAGSVRNGSAMAKKKKKITKAAASDPTSGRVRTVDNNDFLGRWTSVGGVSSIAPDGGELFNNWECAKAAVGANKGKQKGACAQGHDALARPSGV